MVEKIIAPRLELFDLTAGQLFKYLNDVAALEAELGFQVSRSIVDANLSRALGIKLEKLKSAPQEAHPWLTYWLVVLKEPLFGSGMIGFKGVPDATGRVEVGYGIDQAWRNQGYITESLEALRAWAFQHPDCHAITATAVVNPASEKVLEKTGFKIVSRDGGTSSWEFLKRDWQDDGRFQA
ncbi:Acetyltransferase (GNAT) domain-containing protein [Dehalogenimonas formicexedens]|uniref:Acetyltransferase (GNAT) domain-containing protein n=1 Tax=Dehalogenimonas formicexedens TaxID=1839801 RepID=A0A1P8FAP7_9CHLR|nr:GNAT family N-acetyltransferase [Dehalogenimonas formicexedens]APV45508.1 Acetyltransferase (GNAT) domain-containing protein [Dehalogenimonas formicexedens]